MSSNDHTHTFILFSPLWTDMQSVHYCLFLDTLLFIFTQWSRESSAAVLQLCYFNHQLPTKLLADCRCSWYCMHMTSYFRQTGVPTARDQHAHRAGQPAHVRLSRVQRRASRPVILGDFASGSYIQLSVTKLRLVSHGGASFFSSLQQTLALQWLKTDFKLKYHHKTEVILTQKLSTNILWCISSL